LITHNKYIQAIAKVVFDGIGDRKNQLGGCQPACTQFLRTIMARLLFNLKALIVARPFDLFVVFLKCILDG
jgi:hypothetical protein